MSTDRTTAKTKKQTILCRPAQSGDISAIALIRVGDGGTEQYWKERVFRYLAGHLHPKEALGPRAAFVCFEREQAVGFAAGHLTRRFDYDGIGQKGSALTCSPVTGSLEASIPAMAPRF